MSSDSVDYSEWKIILRNESGQQLVLYNENDRRLQVHDSAAIITNNETCLFCKECGRPWTDDSVKPQSKNSSFMMDRNYFRLLDISSRKPLSTTNTMLKYSSESKKNSTSPISSKSSSKSKLSMHSTSADEIYEAEVVKEFHPKNLSDSSINQGYYQRFFREDSKLGRGSGGSVFRCQHVLDGIELGAYAVKKVPVGDDHSWLNRMLREVHILENLRHSNIIEYKHAWLEYHQLTPFGPSIPCLFILMQLAQGGNLEEFVLMNRQQFNSELFCDWFEQLCQGLAHLHRCGILHRDLKPSNILLNLGPQDRIQLLITDFGECTDEHQNGTNWNRTGATGTIEFVAPELLKVDRKSGKYLYQQSKSTDIWSLGLVFYFMITGGLPYPNVEDIDALKASMVNLKSVPLPKEASKIPKGFRKALSAMLQVDPELRPSIEQVLILIKEKPDENRKNQNQILKPKEVKPILPTLPAPIQTNLDENTRISLSLFIICISVVPTYPQIPSFRRIVLALAFTAAAMKISKPRSAFTLIASYIALILAFYFNKID